MIRGCASQRLPLKLLYEYEVIDICSWQETARKFLITLSLPERISEEKLKFWDVKIDRGEIEYVVILGYPVPGSNETANLWQQLATFSTRFKKSFVYWQPTIISEKNLKLISRYYAEHYTYENIQN